MRCEKKLINYNRFILKCRGIISKKNLLNILELHPDLSGQLKSLETINFTYENIIPSYFANDFGLQFYTNEKPGS